MTSFFPFSSSSSSLSTPPSQTLVNDDPHLEITVTPSSSAFYAGEAFSVTITFRNTRIALPSNVPPTPSTIPPTADVVSAVRSMPTISDRHSSQVNLPGRRSQIGSGIKSDNPTNNLVTNAQAGPSRTPMSVNTARTPDSLGYPYSPGANPAYRAPDHRMMIRSPEALRNKDYGNISRGSKHGRRTQSLAIGKGVMSPQEMVWALEGQTNPPPLPSRRPQSSTIPPNHPHSRKVSLASNILSPPSSTSPLPDGTTELRSISESSRAMPDAGPSEPVRPQLRTAHSSSATSSTSASRSNTELNDIPSRPSSDTTVPRSGRRGPSSSYSAHSRAPSYHNAYGASLLSAISAIPPPTHPYIRSQEPRGVTTILWAYTRLVAHFHPSNTYIPPDPLLPLRSMLLHQPVGSGSLINPSSSNDGDAGGPLKSSGSRWQLSFGTGTIGHATQPSLTGSLFGLAKGLVYGGQGGSLEEERKRVWNMKDLPVFETSRSLLGVDVKLKEGESREFVYTIQLPTNLPPAYRGKAFRFSYDLMVSLNVAVPGGGKKQKSKEITVPIRVWANVSLPNPLRTYDVLNPIIQNQDNGIVTEIRPEATHDTQVYQRRSSAEQTKQRGGDTLDSLQAYAKHLLDTLSTSTSSPSLNGRPRLAPLSPSKVHPRARILSPSSPALDLPDAQSSNDKLLEVPGRKTFKARGGSFVKGDDELIEEGGEQGGCGEAVEILSRHSPKSSYDIAKDGEMVAVLTLIKTTYRLGESVLGVVEFNGSAERRVLKFSAYLESNEIIPETLLPFSPSSSGRVRQPPLARLHAEYHSGYSINTSRLAFSLDIPSDGTPAFSLTAGEEGFKGGLDWRVKLAFLASAPKRDKDGVHLLPAAGAVGDGDNKLYTAAPTLSPVVTSRDGGEKEVASEIVECDIPIRVLAGNTAFVVKPSIHVV